jgi:DNA-binding MarR family transcriptional regulator
MAKHDSPGGGRMKEAEAMSRILWTVPSLYHRLTAIGELIYKRHGLTSGKRSLLNDLAEKGPHSLAEMVRARPPVTRQYIQRLITELRNAGMVEFGENPKDLRSKIVRLTEDGQRVIEALRPSELRLANSLADGHSQAELDVAMRMLASVADRLKDLNLRGAMSED